MKNYIPERDGVLLGYLLIEMVATYGRTLGQLIDEMMGELGWFFYDRADLHLAMDKKERLMKALTDNPPSKLNGLEIGQAIFQTVASCICRMAG